MSLPISDETIAYLCFVCWLVQTVVGIGLIATGSWWVGWLVFGEAGVSLIAAGRLSDPSR